MYQKSPMEHFNKNNPFIVISKRKYDSLIDNIQLFSSKCIRGSLINGLIWIMCIIVSCVYIYFKKDYIFPTIIISILLIINVVIIYRYRKKIKYFISDNINIKEFDRISALEVSSIIALNNEDVLKCLHGLYELHGELNATKDHYQVLLEMYGLVELAITIFIGLKILY